MSTMNVSLPGNLKGYVDERVDTDEFSSASEYVRDLIRRDRDRQRLQSLVLVGAASPAGPVADESYFARLRDLAST